MNEEASQLIEDLLKITASGLGVIGLRQEQVELLSPYIEVSKGQMQVKDLHTKLLGITDENVQGQTKSGLESGVDDEET